MSLAVLAAALVVGCSAFFDLVFYSRYHVPGMSMEPTIQPVGEVWTRPAGSAHLGKGEIVVLRPPGAAEIPSRVVTRIVAVAGQTVVAHDGQLLVNGVVSGQAPAFPSITAAITVPPSTVDVLGDNRADSIGSNLYGPVRVDSVVQRVVRTGGRTTATLVVRVVVSLVVALIAAVTCWRMLRRRDSQAPDPAPLPDQPPPLWDT